MSDLISRQDASEAIEDLPSVDAVEVVRCKDCVHRDYDRCEIYDYIKVPDMGFCHEGAKD